MKQSDADQTLSGPADQTGYPDLATIEARLRLGPEPNANKRVSGPNAREDYVRGEVDFKLVAAIDGSWPSPLANLADAWLARAGLSTYHDPRREQARALRARLLVFLDRAATEYGLEHLQERAKVVAREINDGTRMWPDTPADFVNEIAGGTKPVGEAMPRRGDDFGEWAWRDRRQVRYWPFRNRGRTHVVGTTEGLRDLHEKWLQHRYGHDTYRLSDKDIELLERCLPGFDLETGWIADAEAHLITACGIAPSFVAEMSMPNALAVMRRHARPAVPEAEKSGDDILFNRFESTGAGWRITFEGVTHHYPERKGLADLAALVSGRDQRIWCYDLDAWSPRGQRHGQGDGPRPDDQQQRRIAKRIGKRIEEALDLVRDAHPNLGTHLTTHVHKGLECIYRPPEDTAGWVVMT